MTQADQTRTTSFRGRDIVLQDLLPSQHILMIKIARDLKRAGDSLEGSILDVAKLLDILESALPNPEDVEFIEDLIIKRQLDLKEIIYLLAGREEELAKPKVRRGRPPKRTPA
jgi:hypothetical protein